MNFAAWGRLVSYPAPDYQARLQECAATAPSPSIDEFMQRVDGLPTEALQELYTQTFDWNPDTTLDIGWHLFGENYDRGDFLVKMRGALRTHGVAESAELPDHLSHVLPLMDLMPAGERVDFATTFLRPAMNTLCEGLAKSESAFLPLIISLRDRISAAVDDSVIAGAAHD